MEEQGSKIVADLGSRIEEQITVKLAEHKIQDLVDQGVESLAATRDLRSTMEKFLEIQKLQTQNQPAPFVGFPGMAPPYGYPGYQGYTFGGFPGTQGGHGGFGRPEDQSLYGPGSYQAPRRPATAADRPCQQSSVGRQ